MAVTIDGTTGINTPGVVNTAAETIATTLAVTGVTTVQAGTAALPAITTTGDTNTGIFFPAADTIAFAEGGVEAMRIDSSGNLCVGSTAAGNPATKSVSIGLAGTTTGGIQLWSPTTSAHSIQWGDGTSSTDPYRGYIEYDHTGDSMRFATSSTERMRIDSSGNLLVGTTTNYGGRRLDLRGSNTDYLVTFTNSNASPAGLQIYYTGAAPNGTGSSFFNCLDTVGTKVEFRSNGGLANYSANNVNLSDRREKTNFAPATSYLDKICAIPVQTFNYIDQNLEEDAGLTLGVVAQDVQAVAPEMVMESNWGTEEAPKMRLSIYQTDLQYALMKCIQEQQALITALTTRITALEAA
jgi:hypothetical protein